MADEYQLGENSTLSEDCTIAIEARSAQSAESQAAAAPVIINKADWMGTCTEVAYARALVTSHMPKRTNTHTHMKAHVSNNTVG